MSTVTANAAAPAAAAAASAAAIKPLAAGGFLCYQATKSLPGHGFLTLNVVDEGRSISNEPLVDGKQQYAFNLFSVDSTEVHTLHLDYADFDALFRFHPDLMNPNRKADRFFYVLQRLELVSSPSGLKLSIAGAPVGEHFHVPIGSNVQIPIGKLTIQDRIELRRALQGLNAIRDANIAAKKERAHAEFMKIIENNKREAERKFQLRQEAIQREREQRRLFHLEHRKEEMQREAQIQSLQDKRNSQIAKIEQTRKSVGKAETLQTLENFQAASDAHAQAVAAWKEKRRLAIETQKKNEEEEKIRNEELEAIRQEIINERIKAWEARKAAWIVKFKRDDDRRRKRQQVLKEKKLETLHQLDVQRTKVWEELASQRREREEVLRFCRGEDVSATHNTSAAADGSPSAAVLAAAPTLGIEAGEKPEKSGENSKRASIKVSLAPSVLAVAKPAEIRQKRVEEREKRRDLEEAQRAAQLREKLHRAEVKKQIEKSKRKQEREEQQKQLKVKKLKEEQDRKRKAKLREENITRRQAEKISGRHRN